jgi:hypothetical protein
VDHFTKTKWSDLTESDFPAVLVRLEPEGKYCRNLKDSN